MEILGVLGAFTVMFLLYKLIFADFQDFVEAVKYWLTPDAFSFFKGEGMDDFFAELKLGFIIFCGIVTYFGLVSFITG